jgi:phosphoglycerate dehydrogenase-like enzyme
MRRILFLHDLGLSRAEARRQLIETGCGDLEPVWLGDPEAELLDEIEVLVTREHQLGAPEVDRYPGLRMVSLAFTGYEEVDREHCSSLDPPVALYYVPNYSTQAVAELAVAMTLALLRRIVVGHSRLVRGSWASASTTEVLPGLELRGRTVGIIGTGTIGQRAAEMFRNGFDCRIIGWNRTQHPEFSRVGEYRPDSDDVFQEADVVSLHLQLVPSVTEGVANARTIGLMKRDAVLINTARTGLVDLPALVDALRAQRIGGAALDVTKEHHLTPELIALGNVLLTPHIGFQTTVAEARLASIAIENIGRYLRRDSTNRLPPVLSRGTVR